MKNDITDSNIRRNRVDMKAGLAAGFIASAISLMFLALTTWMALVPEFNYVLIQGSIFGFAKTIFSGWIVYFLIGAIFWGSLYAWLEPNLLSPKPITRGIIFGLIVWLIVMVILMPIAGVGIFIKQYGFLSSIIILMTDLVFGVAIACFYERLRK